MNFLIGMLTFLTACACIEKKIENYSDSKDIYASVVKISAVNVVDNSPVPTGTGFAIEDDLIMTAGHVCVSVYEGYARGEFKEKLSITVVHNKVLFVVPEIMEIVSIDEHLDICILRGDHGLIPLKFTDFSTVEIGDKVSVVGSPLGYFPTKTVGYVSLPRYTSAIVKDRLLVSATVSPGNSGGPVVNDHGEVIGMIIEAAGFPFNTPLALAQRSDVLERYYRFLQFEGGLD